MPLAVSFGQGLQMTNILKDIWEDRKRGACWLPQTIFTEYGFDLNNLHPGCTDPRFHAGLTRLIGIAQAYLSDSCAGKRYTAFLSLGAGHGGTDAQQN